ncbi:hypothetical protein [Mucilaginibacter sp.]|nr:hypothetical protein [Mucilaginibacter sp.]
MLHIIYNIGSITLYFPNNDRKIILHYLQKPRDAAQGKRIKITQRVSPI